MTFRSGQVVLLRSGGPAMTVEGIEPNGYSVRDRHSGFDRPVHGEHAHVVWFEGAECKRDTIATAMLMAVGGVQAAEFADLKDRVGRLERAGIEAAREQDRIEATRATNHYEAAPATEEQHRAAAAVSPYGDCYILPNGDCIGRGCPHDVGNQPAMPLVVEYEPTLSEIGKGNRP